MCRELLNALAGDADTSGVIETRLLGLAFSFYLLHTRACSALAPDCHREQGLEHGMLWCSPTDGKFEKAALRIQRAEERRLACDLAAAADFARHSQAAHKVLCYYRCSALSYPAICLRGSYGQYIQFLSLQQILVHRHLIPILQLSEKWQLP